MTDYYWDAGATGFASVDTNWSPVGVPGSGDTIIFTSANSVEDCNMNITEVTTLTMQSSYTGTITLDNAFKVSGHLHLANGTLDTGADYALEVGITLEVDDATAVLNCNDSALTIGQVDTDSGVGLYNSGGTVNGGTGDWTISNVRHNSGTTVLSTGTIIINGKEASSGAAIDIRGSGLTHTAGLIQLGVDDGNIVFYGHNALTLYNLEITSSGHDISTDDTDNVLTITNDLTITAGDLNTLKSGKDVLSALNISGTTTIGSAGASAVDEATLITNESAIVLQGTNGGSPGLEMLAGGTFNGVGNANHTMGSVKAAATTYNSKIYFTSGTTTVDEEATGNMVFVVYSPADVNFYHGNGTVEITTPTYAYMYCYDPFYNLIINHAGTGGNLIALSNGVPLAVDNDLTLSNGDFTTNLQNIVVNGDCYVSNDGHTFDARGADLTVLGQFTLCDGTTYLAGENPVYAGYFSGDNIFGVISMSGTSTMTATTAVTYLTGSAGSTNQDGYTWTPFYQRAGATFNHNNGTFHNKNTQGYIGFGPAGWGPFYNYIQDLTENGSHTLNTNMVCENNLTISGTATLYSGIWGLRNESTYSMHVSGNLTLLAGAGMGGLLYGNSAGARMITRGNIIMHPGSVLTTATGSLGSGWEVGGNLINNGGYVY